MTLPHVDGMDMAIYDRAGGNPGELANLLKCAG